MSHITSPPNNAIAEGRPRISPAGLIEYGIPGVQIQGLTTQVAVTVNTTYYEPFIVTTPIVVDSVVGEVVTISTINNHISFGLYRADTDWQPIAGAPLYDSGFNTLSTGVAGVIGQTGLSIALAPGRYLKAVNMDGTTPAPTLRVVQGGPIWLDAVIGAANVLSTVCQLKVAEGYAAMRNPGTAWTAVNTSTPPFRHLCVLRVSTP